MSDFQLRWEITKIVANSGFEKSPRLICPLTRLISTKYNIEKKRARELAIEVVSQ